MVVPVDNRSYMKKVTDRAKTREKKNNNLSPAPLKLEDNTATDINRSLATTLLGNKSGKLIDQNKDNPQITKMGGYEPVDPTDAPKQTLLQKGDQLANRIRAGGKSKPKIAPAPAPPKPVGRKTTDAGGASPKRKAPGIVGPAAGKAPKPAAPKPAAPKKAAKIAPRPRPKPSRLTGGGMDAELLSTPTGVTSGRVKKTAAKPASKDDGFKFYGKEGTGLGDFSRKHGMQYATQKQFEKDFNMDDGEKAGGRPGRGKLKTQGMNKKGKRKAGFSGRGSGAALRGF